MDQLVTSRDNAQVKLAAGLLSQKKQRDETGLFVCEGLRLCADAAASGIPLLTLLLTPQAEQRYPETRLLRQKAGRTLMIAQPVADKIADTKSPQGVFAICQKLDIRQCAVTINGGGRYLLLENIQDPGNLGTMLRTADALGIDGVFLSAGCPDLYAPKVLRGSMGGVFRLRTTLSPSLADQAAELRQAEVPVYGAALTPGAQPAWEVDFSRGGGVLIGNEGRGLSEPLLTACTGTVVIPMAQSANSLNAAVAAGILMWEMGRNKKEGNGD